MNKQNTLIQHGIDTIQTQDEDVAAVLKNELQRQQNQIELIASENFTSKAVMEAQGTWLTNKYAEGLPGKRYYGGCEHVDVVEQLAINRVKKIFNADHANVQPHSGAQANMAVFLAFLKPGDTVLGMNLSHGGHLTHGSPVNISGIYYNIVPYGVQKETEEIDYDELEKLAKEHQPKMIIGGASAYPREINFERMGQIAKSVGAIFMVDMAHIAGLIAAGLHQSPIPHADVVTSTTHKSLRGPRGGFILCKEQYIKAINKAVFPGTQGGPLMHVIAAKAVAFKEALAPSFKDYQKQVVANAKTLAESLQNHRFNLVSNGTDNHLVLVNLINKGLTGKDAENRLEGAGITCNKNTVPFDTESPFVTSGIRLGTPAVTTRGFKENDMIEVSNIIAQTLTSPENTSEYHQQAKALCDRHPLYTSL